MSSSKFNFLVAIGIFSVILIAIEIVVRTSAVSHQIAFRPIEMVNESIVSAKINALERVDTPTAILIGSSVALGKTMSDYGYKNWREQELASQINIQLANEGSTLRVANYASNGLTPADFSTLIQRAITAQPEAVILVIGIRGFSGSFEGVGHRYTYEWGDPTDKKRPLSSFNHTWQTKPTIEFGLTVLLDGPLNSVLTRIRNICVMDNCEKESHFDGFQIMQMKRRLADISFDPSATFQAGKLSEALTMLDQARIPTLIVYATENPATVSSVISPERLNQARTDLRALIAQSGESLIYLPQDPSLTPEFYVDHMHLTPNGYTHMAKRITPQLLESLH